MAQIKKDIRIKCVMLGDQGVGKTSIINRYILDRFDSYTETTIGASYNAKPVNYNNTIFKLDIWDTAGQERYRSMVPLYYRNSNIVFLCIELSNLDFKNNFMYWYNTLVETEDTNNLRFIYLVGTKSDIKSEFINVIVEELKKSYHIEYIETSSKDNHNIDNLFLNAVEKFAKNYSDTKEKDTLKITEKPINSWRKYFCNLI